MPTLETMQLYRLRTIDAYQLPGKTTDGAIHLEGLMLSVADGGRDLVRTAAFALDIGTSGSIYSAV